MKYKNINNIFKHWTKNNMTTKFNLKTKIIATIGPSCSSEEMINNLLQNGVNIFRLNMSHGSDAYHEELLKHLTEIQKKTNHQFEILVDTKGPEIRTGDFVDGEITIHKDQKVVIKTKEKFLGNSECLFIDYPQLFLEVKSGQLIIIDDGKLKLKITSIQNEDIFCESLNTHTIKNKRKVNLPETHLSMEFLSERDKYDIDLALKYKVKYLAVSFVRNIHDLNEIKQYVTKHINNKLEIISKIETKQSLTALPEIIKNSDGIMIARGDLGVEIDFTEIPI
jgi:pyruvate kinase